MNLEPIESFDNQYAALRSGCGIVELSNWSSATLTGTDRQTFLHNFCTNDVKRLVPGECCEAFFTNVKGKISGHGVISCREDELVVMGVPEQAPRLLAHLDRYVIREDVQIQDTTDRRSYVLLSGHSDDVHFATERIAWNLVGVENAAVYEVAPRDMPLDNATLRELAYVCVGLKAFHTARIEAGVPLFGVDFDERHFPQEVGRNDQAISFTKGCYLGQETVARIDALGHVNQQLVGVRFAGTHQPEVGAALTHEGRTVGQVSSATLSPQLQAPLALAMVRREQGAVGSCLGSPVGECEVVALPVANSG